LPFSFSTVVRLVTMCLVNVTPNKITQATWYQSQTWLNQMIEPNNYTNTEVEKEHFQQNVYKLLY
jgi:hypothetical protein